MGVYQIVAKENLLPQHVLLSFFSNFGYTLGQKAAVDPAQDVSLRDLSSKPALSLTDRGQWANPFTGLSLGAPICRLWGILPPSARVVGEVYEVDCASFKQLNWIFQQGNVVLMNLNTHILCKVFGVSLLLWLCIINESHLLERDY